METAPWTQPTARSRLARAALTAGNSSDPPTVGVQRFEQRCCLGRAYRGGRLICAYVHVTVSLDGRLGLAPDERRLVRVRFQEPLDDGLRAELVLLLRRRGSAACRVAERIDPIELVVDDRNGGPVRVVGRLEPPQVHHGQIRDIEFGLCDLTTR